MKLTGKCRYRSNCRKKLILQVECEESYIVFGFTYTSQKRFFWKDATIEDIQELNIFPNIKCKGE